MTLPVYSTGTVSVNNLGTVVTGAGSMWSGINAREGDFFTRADGVAVITEVTDATHLKITPWPGATIAGGAYAIQQNYVGRVVGVAAAEDVGVMLEKLHTDGLPFIVGTSETVPDPSYGDEGQLAFKPSTGQWWHKSGGVWVMMPPPGVGTGRDRLSGPRTYYYRADGNDGNSGLGNTATDAFRTPQKAYDTICDKVDLNGFNATIKCGSAAGTVFTSGISTSKAPVGNSGSVSVIWDGSGTTVRVTDGTCIDFGAANGFGGYPQMMAMNLRLETLGSGNCINARGGLLEGRNLVFGQCAGNHVFGGHKGQLGLGDYEIAGSPGLNASHIYGYSDFLFWTEGAKTTISAPITVTTYVTLIQGSKGLIGGNTFVNPANVTGVKFVIGAGAFIDSGGTNDLSLLPGSTPGLIYPGGFYDQVGDLSAWQQFTPVITLPAGGAFTSAFCVIRFKRIGKTVLIQGQITITTPGTATGPISMTTPFPMYAVAWVGSAYNIDTRTALLFAGNIYSYGFDLCQFSGAAPWTGAGNRIIFNGSYEIA